LIPGLSRFAIAASIGLCAIGAPQAHAQSNQGPAALERSIPQPMPRSHIAPVIRAPSRIGPGNPSDVGRFTLGAVHVERATAFSQAELGPDFEPFLATEVDQSKLNQIAARITDRYRKEGYLLSYAVVPPQSVQAGIVRIAVFEGQVTALQVEGAGPGRAAIEAAAAPLLKEVPLRAATLERAIGLIRDMPGFTVVDVRLARSDRNPALHSLKIIVARNPIRAFAYSDNRGIDQAARLRFYSSVSFSSLATTGDELKFDLFTIPGKHQRYLYGQVTAAVPIGGDGLRLVLGASAGDLHQRTADRVDGATRNLSAQLSYPLLRSRALTMVGKVAVNDWRGVGDQKLAGNQRDRLRVARIGFDLSNESRTRLTGEFAVSRGLGFDAMTRVGDPLASRPDASGKFTKAAMTVQVARPISEQATLQLAVSGQYADRPLLSVEEFALGGSRFGRAFDFNELTGDHGIAAGLEASYRLGSLKRGPQLIELFGYVDGGKVYQAGSPPGPRSRSLMSVGIGNRFTVAGISFSIEAGVPVEFQGKNKPVRGFFSAYRAF
jgi:hemolysin activation/secretion protein